jgi:hypothetical protein
VTTTETSPDIQRESAPSPTVAIYVEWNGKRFGPYSSIAAAHGDFNFQE